MPMYMQLLHRKIHDQPLLICASPAEASKFILVLGRCVLDNVRLMSRGVMGPKVKMIHHKCDLS